MDYSGSNHKWNQLRSNSNRSTSTLYVFSIFQKHFQATFEPAKMIKSRVENMCNHQLRIDALNIVDQWIEISNNHNGKYTVGNVSMRNSKMEAENMHNLYANIGTLRMECGSIEARNMFNANIVVDSLNIGNGRIEIENVYNLSIEIGILHLENLSIKGTNIFNSVLTIEKLIPSSSHQSIGHNRTLHDIRVNLSDIGLSEGVDAPRLIELVKMR